MSVGCHEFTLWVCVEPKPILYGECYNIIRK